MIEAVRTLVGVKDVNNHIRVKPVVSVGEVKAHLEKVLVRSAETDAANTQVATDGGNVILRGNVRSWSESDEAARAAWTAPGVDEVQNDLIVVPLRGLAPARSYVSLDPDPLSGQDFEIVGIVNTSGVVLIVNRGAIEGIGRWLRIE